MAYRNKTYVAFDGDKDIYHYYLMRAWKSNQYVDFNFYDAHDINTARDTSSEQTIKRRLRERMSNAKCFVLLVGESTRYLYRFVRWEIGLAIESNLPIIVVNLNNTKKMDDSRCPPILRNELAIHVPFKQSIIEYALNNWPSSHSKHRQNRQGGPHYYKNNVYDQFGIV